MKTNNNSASNVNNNNNVEVNNKNNTMKEEAFTSPIVEVLKTVKGIVGSNKTHIYLVATTIFEILGELTLLPGETSFAEFYNEDGELDIINKAALEKLGEFLVKCSISATIPPVLEVITFSVFKHFFPGVAEHGLKALINDIICFAGGTPIFVNPEWEKWEKWEKARVIREAEEDDLVNSIPKLKELPKRSTLKTTSKVNFNIPDNANGAELKEAFDNALKSKAFSFPPVFTKPFVKSVLEKTVVEIDFAAKKLTITKIISKAEALVEVYDAREYVLLTFDSKNSEERVCGVYDASTMLRVAAHLLNNCSYIKRVNEVVACLVSKVFIAQPEQAITNANGRAYGNRNNSQFEGLEIDQQLVYKSNKISGLSVQSLENEFAIAKTEFNGTEFATVLEFFVAINEPVITDKNNKRYFVYGDGARACGVDLVDGVLTTLNPIPRNNEGVIDNGAKVLNRPASNGFDKADEVFLSVDGKIVSEPVSSNLKFALSNNKITAGAGVKVPNVFISVSGGLNNGIMETNATRNVRFEFEQVKNVSSVKISLYSFSEEYRNSLGETPEAQLAALKTQVSEFILGWAENNSVLKARNVVKFQGVVVIKNPTHLDAKIAQKSHVKVSLGASDFNGAVRSLSITAKCLITSVKASPKVRGLGKKATAFPTNTIIENSEGKAQEWLAILNRNAIKTPMAILDVMANDDKFINKTFVYKGGKVLINGEEWTHEDISAWVINQLSTYSIKRPISNEVRDYIEEQNIQGYSFETIEGVLYMVEEVQGFFGNSVMEIEVSTADENHGISNLGLNEQAILAYASSRVNEGLNLANKKAVKKADLLVGGQSIPNFDLSDNPVALADFFGKDKPRTKTYMNALAQKAPNGIRIQWQHPKKDGGFHVWSAELPFGLLLAYGSWDEAGNPTTDVAGTMAYDPEEEVKTSSCIFDEVFDFIEAIKSETISDAEKVNLFVRSNLIANWVEDKRTAKVANKLTKAGLAFHQKIVGDLTIPNIVIDGHSFPVVKIHSANPMVKNIELDALVKKELAVRDVKGTIAGPNEKVKYRFGFLNRCPLPLFTAVVIEFDDTLDETVIAVNPIVWIKSNLGDFDGDLAYLTDGSQFAFNNTLAAAKFNKNYSPLFTSKAGDKVILDALAAKDGVINADKSIAKVVSSWTEINNKVGTREFANLAYNVHNHYQNSVGSLYRVAEALTQGLAIDNPNKLNEAQVKALIKAWFLYEEVGLGGWTIDNQDTVGKLASAVKLILNHKSLDAIQQSNSQGNVLDLIANLVFLGLPMTQTPSVNLTAAERRRASAAPSPVGSEFDYQIVKAAAGIAIAKKIQAGKLSARGHEKAVVVQAISLMSRKDIKDNEAKIFSIVSNMNIDNCRFGNAIKTIGALRCQVKPNK